MKKLLPIIFSIFLLPSILWAATYNCNVASPYAVADFNTCVADVDHQTGEVSITFPAATPTWNTGAAINMASGWTNVTKLTIQGAGTTSTVITIGTVDTGLSITTSTKTFVLKDIGIADARTNHHVSGMVHVSGSGYRVTNVAFSGFDDTGGNDTWALNVVGYGLIDNCTFTANGPGGGGIRVWGPDNSFTGWQTALTFGDENATFVETNTFNWPTQNTSTPDIVLDAYRAARYVFRYNTVNNSMLGHHGLDSGTGQRSPVSFEIYNNTFATSNQYVGGITVRGGTGLVHDNNYTYTGGGVGYGGVGLQIFRACSLMPSAWGRCYTTTQKLCSNLNTDGTYTGTITPCTGDGDCGAGTCSRQFLSTNPDTLCTTGDSNCTYYLDGAGANNYPCRDQPGRGPGQALRPVYVWSNDSKTAGAGTNCTGDTPDEADYLTENVDFCNHSPATDCGSVTGWVYTPYTYPHPLRGATPTTFSGGTLMGGTIQ